MLLNLILLYVWKIDSFLLRYAIADTNVDWSAAEAQVANPGKSTTVSVKVNTTAGQKRKADDTSAHSSAAQGKEKKNRRSMKKAKH